MKFEMKKNMNESELFKLFGKYARYVCGAYVITFNGRDMSADSPSELWDKVKEEYKNVQTSK